MGSPVQGGQARPMQPQQPMGRTATIGNPNQGGYNPQPQGKGPGLPMPNDRMGGQRPYQPVGANNGPFHQNPVAPVQQPIQQMPPQGKGGAVAQPARPIPPGQIDPGFGVNTQPNQGKAPGQPISNMPNNLPSGLSGVIQQPGNNMTTGYGGINGVMQQPNQGQMPPQGKGGAVAQPAIMPMQQPTQGKGPQSPFNTPAQTGPVDLNPAQRQQQIAQYNAMTPQQRSQVMQ